MPADCVFGDEGAIGLISDTSPHVGSSTDRKLEASKQKEGPKPTPKPKPLQVQESFASMLASTERSFSIDATGCTVKLCNGITVHSKSTVAEIFGPNNDRLGYLATASPLGETLGLKAICVNPGHKVKGSTPCQCWVRYSKKKDISSDDRVDLFKSLCQWVAEGTTMLRDEHMDYSFTIREAAGMNPRRLSAAHLTFRN